MTQVAQIFEEEKQQALTQVTQIFEEEKRQAVEEEKKQSAQDNSKKIVIRMINKKYSTEEIVSIVSNYSQEDVEALREEILKANKNM